MPNKPQPSWGAGLVALLGCLLVLVAASRLGVALGEQAFRPPNVHVRLGDVHLVAFTAYPIISSSAATGCTTAAARCRSGRRVPVYAIWVVNGKRIPASTKDAFLQIVAMPLSLAQLLESLST
jgi:hypothetical protein